ncbi:MAG: hypothetical protein NTY69_02585 [Methylococcales bacterium]|nr:hypothetical protein [Methylococcales bacterium]
MISKSKNSKRAWQLPAVFTLALSPLLVMGAQPQTTPAQFDMTGIIENFTLDAGCPAPHSALNDKNNYLADLGSSGAPALACTATVVINGQAVKLPANTVITLPASFLTPYEMFAFNPLCTGGILCTETGLAVQDTNRLPLNSQPATYEAMIQGNIVYDADGTANYIAGLIKVSQEDFNSGDGYINAIDYATGTLYVGGDIGIGFAKPDGTSNGTRIKLNDPVGRFGRVTGPQGVNGGDTQDIRFAVDDGNPTISAETGYPLCIPRTDPAVSIDALCPETNRPVGGLPVNGVTMHTGPFYMPPAVGRPDPNLIAKPVGFPAMNILGDPSKQAPLEVGDFIHFKGTQAIDAGGKYVSAHTISANLGIYTTPGADPAYMVQEVNIVGVASSAGFGGPQEGRELFKIVGFTTDVARMVDTGKVITDPCDGTEAFVNITSQWPNGSSLDQTGNALANVPLGRFRSQFLKGINLGVSMIPATKEIRTQIRGSNPGLLLTAANGITYGQYQAPVGEYIFPENLGFGTLPIVPNNFENLQFLSLGHGPWDLYDPYGIIFGNVNPSPLQGQLAPWPGAPIPATVSCAAGGAAPPVIQVANVTAGINSPVSLNATTTFSPGGTVIGTFSFEQLSGPNVMPVAGAALSSSTLTFTAPNTAQTLTFNLTVCDVLANCSVKLVTVTVTAATDSLTIPVAPTYKVKDGSWTLTVNGTNNTAKVTAHVFNQANVEVLTLTTPPLIQTPGQAVWTFNTRSTIISPAPASLTMRVTSDKGGSVGPIAVVLK